LLVIAAATTAGCGGSAGSSTTPHPAASGPGVQLVYRAVPLGTGNPSSSDMTTSVDVLRQRLHAQFPGARSTVSATGDQIVIHIPDQSPASISRIAPTLTQAARLGFYDWEANVLDPNGKTVASQLPSQNPAALALSQGTGGAPGEGAGGMTLYDAVILASHQPATHSSTSTRGRDEFYAFGRPNSPACSAAARAHGTAPRPNTHCLLAGPVLDRQDLAGSLPPGVSVADALTLRVRPGTVVLQAAPATAGRRASIADPSALFYVLHDQLALRGSEIINPMPSADASGNPNVRFSFTPAGQAAFQRVTGVIARRGNAVSGLGQQLGQHFAVALDDSLITVPYIDFRQYPDGIIASEGADITGGFTRRSAQALATQLRIGPLPVRLELIRMSG
jgi:hypothetical protein